MTPSALCKKTARGLMAAAVFVSPKSSREWTTAMSAELEYVEGSFGALAWAVGCFGTAMKQLCISIISPGAFVVETEANMSKFAKISAVALIIGSALFLLAPTFRQGVRLTASSWNSSNSSWLAKMENLAHKAEANHDAQTLAFVALQMRYRSLEAQPDRDKFADEAVQWDPRLTWIYGYLLSDYGVASEQRDPNDGRWLDLLEAWAPENAAIYAIEASYDRPRGVRGLNPQADRALLVHSSRWLSAMNKAFSATNYDSYLSQARTLERNVFRSDELKDPGNLPWFWVRFGIGAVDSYDFDLYAKDFLLPAGDDFEAEGDFKHAEENYTKVANLAALMQLQRASDSDSFAASNLQLDVDPKLEALYQKGGNSAAAQFVAYQLASARQTKSRLLATGRQRDWSSDLQLFDAYVVQSSLLAMILSLLMIVSWGVYSVMRRLRSKETSGRAAIFSRAGVFGTLLLFVSAMTMYFGFAPYADAFQHYLATPNPVGPPEYLLRFWGLQMLPANVIYWFQGPYSPSRVYLWYAVIAIGIAIIGWIVYRYLSRKFRHSAPMQPAA
jgi:hypothetical protein